MFDVYEYTNQGGRDYNEDAVGHCIDGEYGIFVVADGLGGHSFGEVASACVRDTLTGAWPPAAEDDLGTWLRERIAEANDRILALQKEKGTTLKSTAVVLLIADGQAIWAHVGDSRLYYIHEGRLQEVTEDHSVAFKKYKAGEITKAQIAQDEDQSRLLRTLGSEERNEPTVRFLEKYIVPGDGFLLCSDGAWEYLKDEEIAIDLLKAENAEQWAECLRLRMMDRISPGNDNLTLMTVIMQ